MRILMVANTLPPTDISGVGEQVLQLAAGLEAEGHEVRILGRGRDGARGPKLLFPLTVLPAFNRALRRFRPHVVQVHESDGGLVAWWMAMIGPLLAPQPLLVALLQVSYLEEIRAVRTLRFKEHVLGRPSGRERRFVFLKAPIQVALGCLSAYLADLVLAPSRATAGELERDYRIEGVRVLPNVTGGLEISDKADDADVDAFAESLLFVGRLRIRKGVEVLLHALALARQRLVATAPGAGAGQAPVELRLLVIGDGEHRDTLERVVAELALGDAVSFLGRRGAADVRSLMKRSLALTVPSTYEGMPLVVLEAMECGLPVIASRVSGIPEVVIDGETGWLFESEDVEELAAVLVDVALDREACRHRGAAGTRRLETFYRPPVAARLWLETIGEKSISDVDGRESLEG